MTIELLSRTDLDRGRSFSEVRLQVPGPGDWLEEIRALPMVEEVEPLSAGPSTVQFRVVHRTSAVAQLFRDLQLARRFPFSIRGGVASWVVVASEPKLRLLVGRLRKLAPEVVLESVRHTDLHPPSGPLSVRQTELLHRAMSLGYFEIPRRVTLTDFAKELGISASTLSERLAVIEKKLVEHWPQAGLGTD